MSNDISNKIRLRGFGEKDKGGWILRCGTVLCDDLSFWADSVGFWCDDKWDHINSI